MRLEGLGQRKEGKKAPKTNNANLSAYIGTLRFALCSKAKHLALASAFSQSLSQKSKIFASSLYTREPF